ncbi:hypothetical protein A0H81_05586 [Grifola frondosa]|uniref:Uncharacterized protein n=1 Tax=Grifola frondosa TaxID=5627 RepID=A0A1C7MI33_GRIFR|nr:hypothetical protein A0H81_05586 [Grifola frondosa]
MRDHYQTIVYKAVVLRILKSHECISGYIQTRGAGSARNSAETWAPQANRPRIVHSQSTDNPALLRIFCHVWPCEHDSSDKNLFSCLFSVGKQLTSRPTRAASYDVAIALRQVMFSS